MVDFKFEFHATQVPAQGWDKLTVSLVSLETGKVTAKTGKAIVRDGNCQWAESVLESAKLLQATKGKYMENAMYKFLVSTGSSRMGILGETTINLAEHIGASLPISLSLPLENCISGSILHVRIECLNPGATHRTIEDESDIYLRPGEADEDIHSSSDLSQNDTPSSLEKQKQSNTLITNKEDHAVSALGLCPESMDVEPAPVGEDTDETIKEFSFINKASPVLATGYVERQESDSAMTESIGSKDLGQDPFFSIAVIGAGGKPPKSGGTNRPIPSYPTKPLKDPTGRHMNDTPSMLRWSSQVDVSQTVLPLASDRLSAKSHRRSNSMIANFEAAETALTELQKDPVSWEQQAWKAKNEVERLKQHLASETKHVSEMTIELSALRTELESIKTEAKQLKSIKQVSEDKGNGQAKVYLEVKDAKNTIKELKEELAYEKNVNLSLNLQIQKTNESNSELLLEILDLEELLQKKDTEIEGLKAESYLLKDREQNSSLENMKVTWMKKLQESEEEKQQLTQRIASFETIQKCKPKDENDLEKTVDLLKRELDDLEKDSQELTEENMNLLLKLKETSYTIKEKDDMIALLQSKITMTSEQSLLTETRADNTLASVGSPEILVEKLRAMVVDLKENLRPSEELPQNQLSSSGTLWDDLNFYTMEILSKNSHLEIQLKCSEDKISSFMQELDVMKTEITGHEKERALLASQKGQLKILRGKILEVTKDHEEAMRRNEDLELALTQLRDETSQFIATLQQQLKSTEEKLLEADKECTDLAKRLVDTEAENAKVHEQVTSLLVAKESAEVSVSASMNLISELQERLKDADKNTTQAIDQLHERETEIANLVRDYSRTENQLKVTDDKLSKVETAREELEGRLEAIQEENRLHTFCIKELELQLSALKEDKESMNKSMSTLESKACEIESENMQLLEKLHAAFGSNSRSMEEIETLSMEIRALKAEMESNSTSHFLQNQVLENRNQVLQNQVSTLTEDSLLQEENINKLEERCRLIQHEKDSAMNCILEIQNEKNKLEVALQMVIMRQEEDLKHLHVELNETTKVVDDQKKVILELETSMQTLQSEMDTITISCSNLEEQLQKARENYSASELKVTMLNEEIKSLQIHRTEKHEEADSRLQEAKMQGAETQKRLEDTLQELNSVKRDKNICDKNLAELKERLILLENDKDIFAEENDKTRQNLQYYENLHAELQASKAALNEMKLEKILVETSLHKLNFDHARLVELLANLKENEKTTEEAREKVKHPKVALEQEVLQVQEQNPKGTRRSAELEQRNELTRLRKQMTDLKRKLLEQEEDKKEFRKRISSLEEEVQRKAGLLAFTEKKLKEKEREDRLSNGGSHASSTARTTSRANSKVGPLLNSSPSHDAKDLADLRAKVKILEEKLKIKSVELEATKYVLREKETEACHKEHKENQTENNDSHFDLLQKELKRLQEQNADLRQREHELLSRVGLHDQLKKEIGMLKEEKQQLENILFKYHQVQNGGDIPKRIETSEIELAKEFEANNMYKLQLQRELGGQRNGGGELEGLKMKNAHLEDELKEMQDRYSRMSLQFAEVEAEREQLVMTIRSLRPPNTP